MVCTGEAKEGNGQHRQLAGMIARAADSKPAPAGFLLTSDEVMDLSGYSKPSAQNRWLEQNGLPFLIGGDGRPKVLRNVVERRLGAEPTVKAREPQLRLRQVKETFSKKGKHSTDT